jgi:preprotein translocase subunit SecE
LGVRVPPGLPLERREIMIKNVTQFVKDVQLELSKVTWPKFDEWVGSTLVVLLLMSFFSIYLGLVDKGLTELMRVIFRLYSGY